MGDRALKRVFYASAGAANLIESHEWWRRGLNNPTQVALTFSGQVESFVEEQGLEAYLVSQHPDGRRLADGRFRIEHRARGDGKGIGFFVAGLRYCLGLLRSALRYRADVALLDSGSTQFFMMALFPLFGIAVVPILHNTLWPHGHRPRSRGRRVVQRLEKMFFERAPLAILAVSPEAERQVRELAPGLRCSVRQVRAQFDRAYFAEVPPPPPHGRGPFQVTFVGRAVEEKGVIDIVRMARIAEDRAPGAVRWTLCGDGPDLDRVRVEVDALAVAHVVDVRGWTSPADLKQVHARSHATIVPTRSLFPEGLAMTAVEAVLSGRPVVTNPVVPAHELLAPACIIARTDDVRSHADAVLEMALDGNRYAQLRRATDGLAEIFYDRSAGLTAVLTRLLGDQVGHALDARIDVSRAAPR